MVQFDMFPESKKDTSIGVGNGYSIDWISAKTVRVYRYGVPFKTAVAMKGIDKRYLAVELLMEGGIVKSKLAIALKASRQSIDNWFDTFKKSGFEGLVNSYKGKIEKGRNEKSSQLPVGNKARLLEHERKQKREEHQEKQLLINFDTPTIEEDTQNNLLENKVGMTSEDSKEASIVEEKKKCDEEVVTKITDMATAVDEETNAEKSEPKVPSLFEEIYGFRENRYAGSFIYWGIFQHVYHTMGLCEKVIGHYSVIIYLFAMMLINGFESIESLKVVFKREFGNLIGIKQLYGKSNIWALVHNLCQLKKSKQFIEDFFNHQAKNSVVALHWLYIDGHFVPYSGKELVHMGFYTQRDQAMPGQTDMYVHDCHGHIVYFEIQEGKGDLKEMMRRMSKKWSRYIGNTRPLIIADREAWGVENFLLMANYRFVTWEKHSKAEELSSIPDDKFGSVFIVNEREYQAFEDKKIYKENKGNSIELRRVIIWNKSTGRRVACVCRDEQEDTVTIAVAMLGRWGCSENAFKHMGDRFNMHYNPTINLKNDSDNQEIANPELKKLQKELKSSKKELSKGERQLGKLPLTQKKDGSLRKSKRREDFQEKIIVLKKKISELEEKIKNCPKRVDIKEVKPGKTYKEIDTEGKNFWNLAEALAWNSRKRLARIFEEFLVNKRDLLPALDAITKSRGWVRSTREAVEIRLEPLERPSFKAAQIQLCRYLNEKEIRLKNGKRLLYDVGHAPGKNVQ